MLEQNVVSSFFCKDATSNSEVSEDFLNLVDELNICLEQFTIPSKVEVVYNPTIYASHTFEKYVRKYCNTTKPIMYFGMNPGPWGMSQTGVPFGEISAVRDWLEISGPVGKPPCEIFQRQVLGFECVRSEISGKRFWGLFKGLCGTPENFFKTSFVYNYLPQQWMTKTGRNLTPGDFNVNEIQELYNICDPIFSKVLQLYQVEKIVAVGRFCEARAKKILQKYRSTKPIQILYMPHPSPRTTKNNENNWEDTAKQFLNTSGLLKYYTNESSKFVDMI